MDHSLFPTETKLKFYIERLIYGVAIAMPLQPMVGDVLLWLAVGLAIVDLIRSRSLSLPTGWLSWTVMFFVLWTGVSAALSDNAQWALTSWFYQIVASGGIYYLVRTYISTPKQWRYFLQCTLGTAILVCCIGAYEYIFIPNEDTMFSIGSTVGNGNPQLNAGVSIRLGKRAPESRSRVAMGREIAELNARLQDIENKYNNLLQVLNPHAIDPSKTAEFPDVPRNHWAYQYISQLAGNGILVGYPDGTFKGDATMTRYEFATMLYRALQNGAPIDDNMRRAMNEFQPELQNIRLNHYRVDRISGGDNDRHKTERVRVNNEPKNQRDVYGSRISQ